jgi:hypothetical protein
MTMGVIGGVMVVEVMTVWMMGMMMMRRRLVGRCTPSIRDTSNRDEVPDLPLGSR